MNEMLGFFGVVPITVHITTHIVLYTHVDACIHVVQLINVCTQRACSTLADRALGCKEAAASAAAMALGCQEAACIGCSHVCGHKSRPHAYMNTCTCMQPVMPIINTNIA